MPFSSRITFSNQNPQISKKKISSPPILENFHKISQIPLQPPCFLKNSQKFSNFLKFSQKIFSQIFSKVLLSAERSVFEKILKNIFLKFSQIFLKFSNFLIFSRISQKFSNFLKFSQKYFLKFSQKCSFLQKEAFLRKFSKIFSQKKSQIFCFFFSKIYQKFSNFLKKYFLKFSQKCSFLQKEAFLRKFSKIFFSNFLKFFSQIFCF